MPLALPGGVRPREYTATVAAMRKATAYVGHRVGRLLGTDTEESGLSAAVRAKDRASR